MAVLSPGKIRSLATTSSPRGIFSILALDHRDSLRAVLNPTDPDSIAPETLTAFKLELLRSLGDDATAVMLDPEYSAAQAIATGSLSGSVGFLVALEEQGYLGDPTARTTTLLPGWSVEKAKRLGANGIKLLVLYRPDSGAAAETQDSLIRAVIDDCAAADIALFLEPLLYAADPAAPAGSTQFADERPDLVIETVSRLGALGPDVLKVQFPVDTTIDSDERAWSDACRALDDASPVPWALLSAGDPFELFARQVDVACRAGASGFMVGRALWREAATATDHDRAAIVGEQVRPRFHQLAAIAEEHAIPWSARHHASPIDHEWYQRY